MGRQRGIGQIILLSTEQQKEILPSMKIHRTREKKIKEGPNLWERGKRPEIGKSLNWVIYYMEGRGIEGRG